GARHLLSLVRRVCANAGDDRDFAACLRDRYLDDSAVLGVAERRRLARRSTGHEPRAAPAQDEADQLPEAAFIERAAFERRDQGGIRTGEFHTRTSPSKVMRAGPSSQTRSRRSPFD